MTGVAAVLATVLLVAIGLAIGRRVMTSVSWNRPIRLLPDPVPAGWAEIVRTGFPLSRHLPPGDFERLLKLVQLFLRKKRIEGAGGLVVTDEIRVSVAAQACFLLLWLDVGLYPALRTVIVYPGTVVPRYVPNSLRGGIHDETAVPILGQSWGQGVVILSWDSAQQGAFDPRDGKNLVFHEFAHQLDQETGEADGMPAGLRLSAVKPWAEVIERRFGQLGRAEESGDGMVMDAYGATNHAEFFAVATETFFERPGPLKASKPDLYELLVELYGVDPALGLGARRTDG